MAFQQPQRQPAARPVSYSKPAPSAIVTVPHLLPEEPQEEWVIFSPAAPSATNVDTLSTQRTARTVGRSRLSDFGSLDTAARSDQVDLAPTRDDDETEDLDSLDDGLHAFNEPSANSPPRRALEQSGDTILPNHDGLGMFPGDSSPVQDRFWQFERYNPRRTRHTRRRSSLSRRIDPFDEEDSRKVEDERFQRIEKWRVEQSRALLEEVEKATRRRRKLSRIGSARSHRSHSQVSHQRSTPAEPSSTPEPPTERQESESFWQRFTRRVIQDLMGFDDATLSIIFGEALAPTESKSAPAALSPIARAAHMGTGEENLVAATNVGSWETRLLERIANELGVVVHQLSEHPGAFSTYLRTQEQVEYAGLPNPTRSPANIKEALSSLASPQVSQESSASAGPHFRPTLPRQRRQSLATADPSLWGIEEEVEPDEPAQASLEEDSNAHLQREREYWEKDLDVKMVFGFLRNRFSTSRNPPRSQPSLATGDRQAISPLAASTTSPESLRRAALIRHHHPLVSRNFTSAQQSEARRNSLMQQAQNRPHPSPILGRRPSEAASSCASQSSKRSKTGRSGSSRNYWDIGGGSVGSIGWGEV